MHIHCPHCRSPIEVVEDQELRDVTCPSCGSSFNLLPDETVTRAAVEHRTLGHFELIDRIGVGAFGEVWTAHDSELDRTVAIKLPRKGQLSAEEAESFLREARSAARLNHPSIVAVHEVGKANDQLFIVSDYVRGVTLADWLTGKRPTPKETAALLAQLADAVQHAHEHGVIHRDLKPSNIMMDDADQPHIMDFGLAKREAGEITMTVEGKVLGTPAYMSPEQARGSAHDADARSDVYSLGVILFELLTGELPFRGNARMLVHQVINDEPASPRLFHNGIPRDMETICLKCLEKEPWKRYRTAKDIADDLRRFLTGSPIDARSVTKLERAWRWCRRNRMVASLAAGLAVALLGGLVGVTILWFRADEARVESEKSRGESEKARTESEKSHANAEKTLASMEEQAYGLRMNAAFQAWEIGNNDRLSKLLEECASGKGKREVRGFEWRLLRGLPQEDLSITTLRFNADVAAFAYSGDGKYWAAALVNGEIRLCDQESDEEWTLPAGAADSPTWDRATSVVFSPDSKLLVAGGGGSLGSVRLWELPSRKEIALLVQHDTPVRLVAVCPEGSSGISVDASSVKAWSLPGGTPKWTANIVDCSGVAFLPHGERWSVGVMSPWEGKVTFVDSDTGELQLPRELNLHALASGMAVSRRGKLVATASNRGIELWDMAASELVKLRTVTWVHCDYPVLSPNDDFLAARGHYRPEILLWDLKRDRPAGRFPSQRANGCLAFSADGRRLACCNENGTVKLWDFEADVSRRLLEVDATDWFPLAVSPDKKTVATSRDKRPVLWDTATGEVRELDKHSAIIQAIAFSPSGDCLATGDTQGHIKLWNTRDRSLICSLEGHSWEGVIGVCALAFSYDGKTLASSGINGEVRLWDIDSRHSQPLEGQQGSILGLVFSPDRRFLVAGCGFYDGEEKGKNETRIWDIQSVAPRCVATLPGHRAQAMALAFSADGKMLAISGMMERVLVYETETWQEICELPVNGTITSGLAFSPDDRTLLAAGPCGDVKFWQVGSWHEVGTLRMNEHVRKVAFLDENTLITASMEGFVRVWRASPVGPR